MAYLIGMCCRCSVSMAAELIAILQFMLLDKTEGSGDVHEKKESKGYGVAGRHTKPCMMAVCNIGGL